MRPQFSEPYGFGVPAQMPVTRARSWLVALIAFLVTLVIMAAIGNPPVSRSIIRQTNTNGLTFKNSVLGSALQIRWSFGAPAGDTVRAWLALLLGDVAALILVFLLVAVVARGFGGFWQLLFGVWMSVVASMMISDYVVRAVVDSRGQRDGLGAGTYIFFSGNTASGLLYRLFAGLGFGLVIALISAGVGAASRQKFLLVDAAALAGAQAAGYPGEQSPYPDGGRAEAGYPPPYSSSEYPSTPYGSGYQDRSGYEDRSAYRSEDQPTRSWDSRDDRSSGSGIPGPIASTPWSDGSRDEDHQTQSFERPPDDDDRGAHPTAVLPAVGDEPRRPASGSSTGTGDQTHDDQHTTEYPPYDGEGGARHRD